MNKFGDKISCGFPDMRLARAWAADQNDVGLVEATHSDGTDARAPR